MVTFADKVVPMSPTDPTDITCLVGCAVLTGAGAVLHTAKVGLGQSVAVFGVGGVGSSAIGAAAIAGANPIIAVDLVDRKLQFAREFGLPTVSMPRTPTLSMRSGRSTQAELTMPWTQSARRQPLSRFWRQSSREGQERTTKVAWQCSSGFPSRMSRST
jgi:Zn-dependent alcohol dehydrogenase